MCIAAEHSSSAGQLIQDEMQLLAGGFPVVFGCETQETGEIYRQEADGIMGLGNSAVSVVNQVHLCLVDLCYVCITLQAPASCLL